MGNLACFLSSADFFLNLSGISVTNNMDPDQALCFIAPDLGPNCLQMSTADDKDHDW